MKKIVYSIQFYSDWHCSSGLTSGADVDSLVIRDQHRLPYIPGRTLKGLFSEAACILTQFSDKKEKEDWEKFLRECFGEQTDKSSDQSNEGACFFSNAELTKAVKEHFVVQQCHVNALFRKIASTAIEEEGQAREHSLRKMEVTVPVKLFGFIDCPDSSIEKMEKCLKWVKRLGTNRNRGLGRCDIQKIKEAM